MYQLRRLRLRSIGAADCRFDPLDVDFTEPGGRPVDSVLWLRNGGGKTALLSLFFSLLNPRSDDFLGYRQHGKRLANHILDGDTAHVIAEWQLDGGGKLCTGMVLEWGGRQRSGDESSLRRAWYLFRPRVHMLTLDTVPVVDDTGRRRLWRADVLGELRLAAKRHPDLAMVITETQAEWRSTLLEARLDPEMLRYQVRMNADEGAADEFLFDARRGSHARSGDAFVDFLLRVVLDPETPELVATSLRAAAEQLAERPGLELEQRFLIATIPALQHVIEAARERRDAHAASRDAVAQAIALRGSLGDAVTRCGEEVSVHLAEATRLRDEAAAVARTAAGFDRRTRELRWTAARLRIADLEQGLDDAEAGAAEASQRKRAWEAVEGVIERASLEHRLVTLRRQLESVAAPLREELEWAGGELVTALQGASTATRRHSYEATVAATKAEADADGAERETRDASAAIARLETQMLHIDQQCSNLDEKRVRLVERGDLGGDEPAMSALGHLDNEAAARRERLDQLAARLEALNSSDETALSTRLNAERDEVRTDRQRADQQRADCDGAATALATDARLRVVAEHDEIDLSAEAVLLRDRLAQLVAEGERRLLNGEAAAMDDERALVAIETTGLLCGTRDLERALAVVRDAGISAVSGHAWIADNVSMDRRSAVIAASPALAGGIVVTRPADVPAAATALRAQNLRPTSVLVAGTAIPLANPDGLSSDVETILPHSALMDREAAVAHRAQLTAEREHRLDARRRNETAVELDRALATRLSKHIEAWPLTRRRALDGEIETLEHRLDVLDQQREELAQRQRNRQQERTSLMADERALHQQNEEAAARRGRLAGVAELEGFRSGWLAERAAAIEGVTNARQMQSVAREVLTRARTLARGCHVDAARLEGEAAILDRERASVAHQPGAVKDGTHDVVPLDALRGGYELLRKRYEGELTDSDLGAKVRAAEERMVKIDSNLAEFDADVRALAHSLEGEAAALDQPALSSARRTAEQRHEEVIHEMGAISADLSRARALANDLAPVDRPRHDPTLEDLPTSAEDAEGLAIQAETERSQHDVRSKDMVMSAEDKEARSADAGRRADALEAQRKRLEDQLRDSATGPGTDQPNPFDGTVEDALERTDSVVATLGEAASRIARAEKDVNTKLNSLVVTVTADEFRALSSPVRQRCGSATADAAFADESAPHLHSELQVRLPLLSNRLDQIREDRQRVVVSLGLVVRKAFHTLRQTQNASVLPAELGAWSGLAFFRLGCDEPQDDEQLHARLERVVDETVGRNDRLEGIQLVLDAVRAANRRPQGFTASILKPDAVLRPERVDVSELRNFSGGQKLTTAILLYCAFARQRAHGRARGGGGVGVLVLDNPLGKASHLQFIDLQRKVAAGLGAQLIFATGVRDEEALALFPNRIRLRNEIDRRRHRTHVVSGAPPGTTDQDTVRSARVVRTADLFADVRL